jgi:hypothetical protein
MGLIDFNIVKAKPVYPIPLDALFEWRVQIAFFDAFVRNRSHPLPLILSVAAGLAFV